MATRTTYLRIEALALIIVVRKKSVSLFLLYRIFKTQESKQDRHMKDGFNYADPLAGACAPGVQTTKWKM